MRRRPRRAMVRMVAGLARPYRTARSVRGRDPEFDAQRDRERTSELVVVPVVVGRDALAGPTSESTTASTSSHVGPKSGPSSEPRNRWARSTSTNSRNRSDVAPEGQLQLIGVEPFEAAAGSEV